MDQSKFVMIYPTYLDSSKTLKVGRRIAAEIAVDCPMILDLSDACRTLRYRHVVQPWKGYSRDPDSRWNNPGRLLVDMESTSLNSKIELIKRIAKTIPTMPTRIQRVQEKLTKQKQMEEKEKQKAAEKEKAAAASMAKKKNKGKKRR